MALPSDGDDGNVSAPHPSSVLMVLLNTSAIEETVVRRVNGGFGDEFKVRESHRTLTLELDFLTSESAKAWANIIAEEADSFMKDRKEKLDRHGMAVASYEVVPGESGRLTNIRVNVFNN